jgi:hypothetical protein
MRRRFGLLHDATVSHRHLSGCGYVGDLHADAVTRNGNPDAYSHRVADADTNGQYTHADTVGCGDSDSDACTNGDRVSGSDRTPGLGYQCDRLNALGGQCQFVSGFRNAED